MIQRFLEQHDTIYLALVQLKPDEESDVRRALSACHIKILDELRNVISPFKLVTELMSSETDCTISSVHPTKHKLLKQLKEAKITSCAVIQSRNTIVVDLSKRYTDDDSDMLLKEACFLDPRYKNLPYLPESEKKSLHQHIISHCTLLHSFIEKNEVLMVTDSSDESVEAGTASASTSSAAAA